MTKTLKSQRNLIDGASSGGNAGPLDSHVGGGVAGGEGVVVGEDHIFGAVAAEGGLVVAADDGEGVEDVGGVCAGEAVEVEVEGVEAGAQVTALLFVDAEGFKMGSFVEVDVVHRHRPAFGFKSNFQCTLKGLFYIVPQQFAFQAHLTGLSGTEP